MTVRDILTLAAGSLALALYIAAFGLVFVVAGIALGA